MNRYRIKHKPTGEVVAVSHHIADEACREVGWDPRDCYVMELRPTKDWKPIKRYVAPEVKPSQEVEHE